MRTFLIVTLVFLLHHQQYVASQGGIRITCPASKTIAESFLIIDDPRTSFDITAQVSKIRYEYDDQTSTPKDFELDANAASHRLEGFGVGETRVTVSIDDEIERALCTFRLFRNALLISCPSPPSSQVACAAGSSFVTFSPATTTNGVAPISISYTSSSITFNTQNNQVTASFPLGQSTVVASASDSAGQTVSCQFNVLVSPGDTSPPQINCPPNQAFQVQCGVSNTQVQLQAATASDNSGPPSIVYSSGSIQFTLQGTTVSANFGLGVTTVISTATDDCGLTASCQFTVTVATAVDNVPPTITCAANINQQLQCGTANTRVNFPATASDNCGAVSVVYTFQGVTNLGSQSQSSATLNVGSTTITATATDSSGRTASCETMVSITEVDNVPPTITCAANINQQLQCGTANTRVNFPATASDNCGAVSVVYTFQGVTNLGSQSQSSATLNVGSTTITATATDSSGRTASCETMVSITEVDNVPPTITCAANINQQLQCGTANTRVNFPATAFDNCGAVSVVYTFQGVTNLGSQSQSSATLNVGSTTITATATDSSGRTASCETMVSITEVDNVPPTITCAANINQQLQCGTANTRVNFPATASDNCGAVSVVYTFQGVTNLGSQSQSSATLNVGSTTITATATDSSGRTASCETMVSITEVDNVPPTITCAANINQQLQCGTANTRVNFPATASDNCGAVSVVYTFQGVTNLGSQSQSSATLNVGSTTITATATDSSGRTASCETMVSITEVDNVPPTITCAANINQQLQCGTANTRVNFPATASDNCGAVSVVYTFQGVTNLGSQSQSSATLNVGSTTITATATDSSGRTASCETMVSITEVDNVPPTITCAANINQQLQCGTANTRVNFPATASDNCGAVSVVYTFQGVTNLGSQSQSSATLNVGSTTITATATDSSGRTASCETMVSITEVDNVPPAITCTANINQQVPCGTGITQVNFPATASDNCGAVSVMYTSQGTTTLGPQSQSSATINVGDTTIIATATDSSGRTASCETVVSITEVDNFPPTINCAANVILQVPCGSSNTQVNFPATASDTCGAVSIVYASQGSTNFISQSQSSATMNVGFSTITATATDISGRTASCETTISITEVDNFPPTINCPANINLQVPCGSANTQVNFPATASDNCGAVSVMYTSQGTTTLVSQSQSSATLNVGSTTITATATDSSGRTASCETAVSITEVDNFPPTIKCAENINQQLQCGTANTQVNFPATASDNCGAVSVIYTFQGATNLDSQGQSSATINVGSTTITATATDSSGRTDSCQTMVTITEVDNFAPTINCAENINQQLQCGTANTQVSFPATASDNCGAVSVVYTFEGATNLGSQSQSSANINVGFTTVTATATDSSGRTAFCETTVTITEVDNFPPTINCAENINLQVPCGSANTQVNFPATASDNCGAVSVVYASEGATNLVSQSQSSAAINVGSTKITATATDSSGRTSSCETTVLITEVDNSPPFIVCATNINEQVQCGTTNTQVNFPAVAIDNCGPATISFTSSGATTFSSQGQSNAPMNIGLSRVIATAIDGSGETATCNIEVSITEVDNLPPTISYPQNITEQIPCGISSTEVNFPVTVTDNCGPVSVTYSSGGSTVFSAQRQSSANMNVGTSAITAVATDNSQRTSTSQFTVTITEVDDQPPQIQCPENQQITLCSGESSTLLTWPAATATDNCGAVSGEYSASGATFFPSQAQTTASFRLGSTTVTATTTDSSGQTADCQFTVTVDAVDPCANHACQNGGQCAALPGSCSQYYCVCPPCFYGQFCENRSDPCLNQRCENGAICTPEPNSCTDYKCSCPSCFYGQYCKDRIPDPCNNNPCVNGGQCSRVQGTCYAYQCSCQPGYEGIHCEIRTLVYVDPCNTFPCKNGGTCTCLETNYYVCTCPPGYGGIDCETLISTAPNLESCSNDPCQNNGECHNSFDENSATQGVYNNQYTCVCQNGYGGSNCNTLLVNNPVLDACSTNTCRNGGTCTNAYFSFSQRNAAFCTCQPGFFGKNCKIGIDDPCNSNPCQNAGRCTSFNTYFVCTCANQFSGIACGIIEKDNTPPTVNCPANQQATINQGQIGTAVTYPAATGFDSSGVVSLFYSNPSGYYFSANPSTTTVTVTASDRSGNSAQCTFTVTVTVTGVLDTIPPIVTCPENQLATAQSGQNDIVVNYPPATGIDESGGQVTFTYSNPSGSSFNIGRTVVTVTGRDPSGNVEQCTFTITVTAAGPGPDTIPPDVICPPAQQVSITQGQSGTVVTYPPATATDNSGGVVSLSYSQPSGTFFSANPPTTTVTVTGTDPSRNTQTCTFSVTLSVVGIIDTISPVVTCPPNQQVTAPSGQNGAVVNYSPATATDNSGGPVTLNYGNPSGSFFNIGQTVIAVTGRDPSGNIGQCTFTITVTGSGTGDTTPPEVNCPGDQQVMITQGQQSIVVTYPPATATDDSNGFVSLSYSPASGSIFSANPPTTLVTVIGTDSSGNSAQCTFRVILTEAGPGPDTTAPSVNCPQDQQVSITQGQSGTVVSYPPATATDNSGGVVSLSYSQPSGTFFSANPPTTTVTVTGTDPSGNTQTCTFSVTLSVSGPGPDTIPPSVNCPQDQQVSITQGQSGTVVSYPPATATDNSGGFVSLSYSQPSGTFFSANPPTTTVTVTGTDPSENTQTCAFSVTLSDSGDTVSPVITCPPDQLFYTGSGQVQSVVSYPSATATDNSGNQIIITYDREPGSLFNLAVTTVTATATDPSGNTDQCTFTITLNVDIQPPWPVCPENQVRTVPQGSGGTQVTYPMATASDNNGDTVQISYSNQAGSFFNVGTTVVTATASDTFGNTASCIFAVTVNIAGQQVPTVSGCVSSSSQLQVDTNAKLAVGQTSTEVTWSVPTATPSSTVMTHNSLSSGSQFPAGLTEIIYIFGTEGAQATCTYRVFVIGSGGHSCTSNPCQPTTQCFFSDTSYICLGSVGRKKRGTHDNPYCGPFCDVMGGICANQTHYGDTFEPQCFYPGYQEPDPCQNQPCYNNGTCNPLYDLESAPSYFCICPPGWRGYNCEYPSQPQLDNGEIDHMKKDETMRGYWFIYILLGIICLIVLMQSVIVCRLVAKQIRGIPMNEKTGDEKNVY